MADTFGGITLPVGVTSPAGDPVLGKLASFIQAVANHYVGAAFDATKATSEMATENPIATVFPGIRPMRFVFEDRQLPALFLYRNTLEFGQRTADDEESKDEVIGLWLFPRDDYNRVDDRIPIWNALVKAIHAGLKAGVHPAWVDGGDTTPRAASAAADIDAIKTAFATSVAPQSYSGVALNGVVGVGAMDPRRGISITTTASAGTYVGPAVVTFVDWNNRTRSKNIALAADGGETALLLEDVKSVVSVALPAQNNVNGSISIGTTASAGTGSDLASRAGVQVAEIMSARYVEHTVEILSGDDEDPKLVTRKYDAIEMRLEIIEDHVIDTTDATRFHPNAVDFDVEQAGFTTSASLPT